MKREEFEISGMTCQHCVHAVKKALEKVTGVRFVEVNLQDAIVTIEYDEHLFDSKKAQVAVHDAGYEMILA